MRSSTRQRVLSDAEIREVWAAAEAVGGPYGAFVKMLLLTGQRRNEVAGMRRSEIEDAVWTVPAERMKSGRRHEVPLSEATLAVIKAAVPIADGDCVFTTDRLKGATLASSCAYIKTMMDCAILAARRDEFRAEATSATRSSRCRTGRSMICGGRCARDCPS